MSWVIGWDESGHSDRRFWKRVHKLRRRYQVDHVSCDRDRVEAVRWRPGGSEAGRSLAEDKQGTREKKKMSEKATATGKVVSYFGD